MLCDFHMHSRFSADSHAKPEEMLQRALQLSMPAMCVTDHLDFDFPDPMQEGLNFALDIPEYFDAWNALREEAERKKLPISISIGMETGLETDKRERLGRAIRTRPFDFIIGSSHLVNGMDPYYPVFFEGYTEDQAYLRYFESVLDNVQAGHDYDVYGHIDYIVRYGPNKNKYYSYRKYQDILDAILSGIIASGKGIEANTGGYFSGLGTPNPNLDVISRYRELGGEIITIGSDAHVPERIGGYFDRAREILLAAGFRYYCMFRERKPVFLKL